MLTHFRTKAIALGTILVSLLAVTPALAGAPQLDTGAVLDSSNTEPYKSAQPITNVFDNKEIFGKLDSKTGIDIYSFTADKDGEQTFDLLVNKEQNASEQNAQLLLLFIDPTNATQAAQLRLTMPGDNYHPAIVTQLDPAQSYNEPVLMRQFNKIADQRISLKKGTTYYLFVGETQPQLTPYIIKLGDGPAWTARDFFRNFGTWFRVETNSYAGVSPFQFSASIFGLLLALLGLIVLIGMLVVQETFSLLANRSKPAGFLLVKMQPYSRIFIWVSLWFILVGGYIYLDKVGWVGIPFVLILLFIVVVANLLYQTIALSPKVAQLEVTKKEATIPFSLRKRWFFTTLISLFSLGGFVVLLSMYFVK